MAGCKILSFINQTFHLITAYMSFPVPLNDKKNTHQRPFISNAEKREELKQWTFQLINTVDNHSDN